jgi:hypothetical protein
MPLNCTNVIKKTLISNTATVLLLNKNKQLKGGKD